MFVWCCTSFGFCRLTIFCMDTLALLESKDMAFKNNCFVKGALLASLGPLRQDLAGCKSMIHTTSNEDVKPPPTTASNDFEVIFDTWTLGLTWTDHIFTDEQMALTEAVDDSGCQSFQKFPGRCSHIYAPFPFGERCVHKDGEPQVRCVRLCAKLLWDV